jgi:hypothetical protein
LLFAGADDYPGKVSRRYILIVIFLVFFFFLTLFFNFLHNAVGCDFDL